MILEKLIEINLQVLSLTDILKLSECNKNIHQIVWNHIKYLKMIIMIFIKRIQKT